MMKSITECSVKMAQYCVPAMWLLHIESTTFYTGYIHRQSVNFVDYSSLILSNATFIVEI